jgi:hypothetical protein
MKKKLTGVNNIIGKIYFKKYKSGEPFFLPQIRKLGKLPGAGICGSGYEFISISHRLLIRYRVSFLRTTGIKMQFDKN